MEKSLRNFTESFFKSLKANVIVYENYLEVSNVPEKFEKFLGKKAPYKIVFSASEEGDVVAKGSHFLRCMSNFLENMGETTLLKIEFDKDVTNELNNLLLVSNCEIKEINRKKRNKLFVRFTFQTTINFLNKSNKLINHIFVLDGKIVSGNLDNYEVVEGDSKEINSSEVKRDYEVAKNEVSKRIALDIEKFSAILKRSLNKEIARIEEHFEQHSLEHLHSIKENEDKIQQSIIDLERNPKDKIKILNRIKKLESIIEKTKDSTDLKKFEKEKEQEINNEKLKHSLNVQNKLINTTIIYYPLSVFSIFLKNSFSGRVFEKVYDPLKENWDETFCESCKNKVNKIFLCSSGHISCEDCFSFCRSCNKGFCKVCLSKKCSLCDKMVCKDCVVRCYSCGKSVCKSHSRVEKMSERSFCIGCLKLCSKCNEYRNPKYFKRSVLTNNELCEFCSVKEAQEKFRKELSF